MQFITRKPWLIAASLAMLLSVAACGGDDDDGSSATPADTTDVSSGSPAPSNSGEPCDADVTQTEIDSPLLPLVLSSDLEVGENRFQIGLIDQASQTPVANAELHFTFVCYDTEEGTEAFEIDATPVTLEKSYTHTHADGLVESHPAGETGAYVAYVEFDRPGVWGVEVSGTTPDGEEIPVETPKFSVNLSSFGLTPGDPAPPSVQPIVPDVTDIRDIDTSVEPIEAQHNLTIADAVTSGKPTVVAFVTPAFCTSQICGPVKGIFDDLYAEYGEQANFVHIEPYDVPRMRSGDCPSLAECLNPLMEEWKLNSEPWVFIIDADGNIAAKFDGIASLEEMEAALEPLVSS